MGIVGGAGLAGFIHNHWWTVGDSRGGHNDARLNEILCSFYSTDRNLYIIYLIIFKSSTFTICPKLELRVLSGCWFPICVDIKWYYLNFKILTPQFQSQ